MGEEGRLRELPVQRATRSTPSSATAPASSGCSCWRRCAALLHADRLAAPAPAVLAGHGRRRRGRLPLHAPGSAVERPPAALLLPGALPARPPSASPSSAATVAALVSRRHPRGPCAPCCGVTAVAGRRRVARRARACRCTRLPGWPVTTSPRRSDVRTSGVRCATNDSASSTRGRGGTSRATRASPPTPSTTTSSQTMAEARRDQRLRPGDVGVRGGAQPLRHADGADAAAVLDRRLHRLDGGPLLRGLGHHAVPLPQPGRALDRAVQRPARPALRPGRLDQRRVRPRRRSTSRCSGVRYYMAISDRA